MNRPGSCVKMIAMSDTLIHHYPVEYGALAYAWSHGPVSRPLVMLHGLGDSAIHTFRPRAAQGPLADSPILFIDLPGFGESRFQADHPATIERFAADVAELLRSLHIDSTAVFGHSMGGNVAIHLAHFHPELVSKLAVAEPLLEPGQSVLAADIARFDEQTFIARRFPLLLRATRLQANRGDVSVQAFLGPLQLAEPSALFRSATSLMESAAISSEHMLRQLTIPRTFLIGERTRADVSQIEAAGVAVNRVPNAGHHMLVEAVFATSCAILEATT